MKVQYDFNYGDAAMPVDGTDFCCKLSGMYIYVCPHEVSLEEILGPKFVQYPGDNARLSL